MEALSLVSSICSISFSCFLFNKALRNREMNNFTVFGIAIPAVILVNYQYTFSFLNFMYKLFEFDIDSSTYYNIGFDIVSLFFVFILTVTMCSTIALMYKLIQKLSKVRIKIFTVKQQN